MKNVKYNDCFEDNELIYLFQSETNIKAKDILFEKYRKKLFAATMRYIYKWLPNLPLEMADLISINYSNFMIAIQSYNVRNNKFDFASCLFTINRSELRKIIKYYFQNNNQKVMTNYISLTEDVESSSAYNKAIATESDVIKTENSIAYDCLQESIRALLTGQSFMVRIVYTLFTFGFDPVQIAKIFNLNINQVYFIIKKMNNLVREENKLC